MRLHNSIWVQIKLSFWTVVLQVLLGLGLALLLNVHSRLLEALRTVFLDPDGAAADRGRHHLEGALHARHQLLHWAFQPPGLAACPR